MAFRLRFCDWHDIITVDYTITPQMIENRKKEFSVMTHTHIYILTNRLLNYISQPVPFGSPVKKPPKVDLSSLFHPRKTLMSNSEAEELIAYYNSLLKMMQCCVIEGRKFSILPREEKGL